MFLPFLLLKPLRNGRFTSEIAAVSEAKRETGTWIRKWF
jgi:hypothetical protein